VEKPIEISQHAREQMIERGAKEEEVLTAIRQGEAGPTRMGRVMYRKNFQFNRRWTRVGRVPSIIGVEINKNIRQDSIIMFYLRCSMFNVKTS